MGFIIKPVVTEKMNAVTEKSSVDKTIKQMRSQLRHTTQQLKLVAMSLRINVILKA
mgnify:CR=1 FL=1